MSKKLHTVAETATYLRDADRQGLSAEARLDIVNAVAEAPTQGDEIRGSGGIRKVRFAGRGKGKSAVIARSSPIWDQTSQSTCSPC